MKLETSEALSGWLAYIWFRADTLIALNPVKTRRNLH